MKIILKVINLFGGPGTGKSTTAAGLFHLMKIKYYNVELVTEFAKDLAWENRTSIFSDQLYILAKQNRRLERLRDKVEWAITDSPLVLSLNYTTPNYLPIHFKSLVGELFDTYHNHNFFLTRIKEYVPIGRSQTNEEARLLDKAIHEMLIYNGYTFSNIVADNSAPKVIFDILTN